MNLTLRTFAGISLLLPVAFGCAGRTAPFNELDKAPITIMRIGPDTPVQTTPTATTTPSLIPGLSPELQKMGEQAMQGLQQMLPPGTIPPGLIPGTTTTTTTPPVQQQPHFKQFVILGSVQLNDEDMQDDLLDLFGDEDSFQADHPNCFSPGLGISINRSGQVPVDLLVSFSCNQAQGDGFRWPYKVNGLTPDASKSLSKVFEKYFGPVPPGA